MGKGSRREHMRNAAKRQNVINAGGSSLEIPMPKDHDWYKEERQADLDDEPPENVIEIHMPNQTDPEKIEAQLNELQEAINQADPNYQTPEEARRDLEVQVEKLTRHPDLNFQDEICNELTLRYQRRYTENELNSLVNTAVEAAGFSSSGLEEKVKSVRKVRSVSNSPRRTAPVPASSYKAPAEDVPEDCRMTDEMIAEINKNAGEVSPVNENSNLPQTPSKRVPADGQFEKLLRYMSIVQKTALIVAGFGLATMGIIVGNAFYRESNLKRNYNTDKIANPTRQERLIDEDSSRSPEKLVISDLAPVKIGGHEYMWVKIDPAKVVAANSNLEGRFIFKYAPVKREDVIVRVNPGNEVEYIPKRGLEVLIEDPKIRGVRLPEGKKPSELKFADGTVRYLYETVQGIAMVENPILKTDPDGTESYFPKYGACYMLTHVNK
jgi:hypothetical protein